MCGAAVRSALRRHSGALRSVRWSRCLHTRASTPLDQLVSLYKQTMAQHASPLAVITAASGSETRAATVSSVASLSVATPGAPLVSFNLRVPSSTSRLIHGSGRFSVNFLSGARGVENIAQGFAGGAPPPRDEGRTEDRMALVQEGEQIEVYDLDWFPVSPEPFCTPMLNRTNVVSGSSTNGQAQPLAYCRLDCNVVSCFTVRDHEIWVGEVERIDYNGDLKDSECPALVYFDKQFVRVHRNTSSSVDAPSRHRLVST
ncbi:flavin reductase like domain-containing protein [Limtongia smithiae]|uniref:flavin reductase like domain-containing protein n=1 Tax=Limtongia smithiae TaxID=1125753 RepID=UPI0034CEB474